VCIVYQLFLNGIIYGLGVISIPLEKLGSLTLMAFIVLAIFIHVSQGSFARPKQSICGQ
jgi:hypothetical protein